MKPAVSQRQDQKDGDRNAEAKIAQRWIINVLTAFIVPEVTAVFYHREKRKRFPQFSDWPIFLKGNFLWTKIPPSALSPPPSRHENHKENNSRLISRSKRPGVKCKVAAASILCRWLGKRNAPQRNHQQNPLDPAFQLRGPKKTAPDAKTKYSLNPYYLRPATPFGNTWGRRAKQLCSL